MQANDLLSELEDLDERIAAARRLEESERRITEDAKSRWALAKATFDELVARKSSLQESIDEMKAEGLFTEPLPADDDGEGWARLQRTDAVLGVMRAIATDAGADEVWNVLRARGRDDARRDVANALGYLEKQQLLTRVSRGSYRMSEAASTT